MKTTTIALFVFFSQLIAFSQDTLTCTKDLTWSKMGMFYYKTGDASKTPYTGPAKCFPKKGQENRGYLKEGRWEGKVMGYEADRLLGSYSFKGGIYDGLGMTYDKNGNVKDSSWFSMGDRTSYYGVVRDKYENITSITKKDELTGMMEVDYYAIEEEQSYVSMIDRFKGKAKHGKQEEFRLGTDENGAYVPMLMKITMYENGKKHGKSISYDADGMVIEEIEYKNGKVVSSN